jgi:hypothetical protein
MCKIFKRRTYVIFLKNNAIKYSKLAEVAKIVLSVLRLNLSLTRENRQLVDSDFHSILHIQSVKCP